VNLDHVHLFIQTLLEKAFTEKRFAIGGAWLGSGGELYTGTEGVF